MCRFPVRRTLAALVALSGFLLAPTAAFAWGRDGHRAVAAVAEQLLTPEAKAGIATLLEPGQSLADVASWADEVRPERPNTGGWHYVNVPITTAGYDADRDCHTRECVVPQVERFSALVADRWLPTPIRATALKFLVHFVGDLHQPMHVGENHDRGGNDVKVVLAGTETNLHRVWDSQILQKGWGKDGAAMAPQLLAALTPQHRVRWSKGDAASWAQESWAVSRDAIYPALGAEIPPAITPDTAQRWLPIMEQRITQAGVRLALLLNRAFPAS
ncbi:S1/P1 nuclease [Oleisolibacter albus]|uniref:S1/P1 nuclease n=1 Tax=Oleisolibacter albus TaxID=2171757 RepID=UPI000DF46774|nr:S1/P1 nuclease [Oleisolibacter albus]